MIVGPGLVHVVSFIMLHALPMPAKGIVVSTWYKGLAKLFHWSE